jgi:uncharacterized protein YkwD
MPRNNAVAIMKLQLWFSRGVLSHMKFKLFPVGAVACAAAGCSAQPAAQIFQAPRFSVNKTQTEKKTDARLEQSDARLTKLENLMFDYVNAAREKAGLKSLTLDSTLSEVARAHSAEMRDKDYFAHESPTEKLKTPLDRYRLGFESTPRLVAENIFRAWGDRKELSAKDALRAHNSLMNSPGHRANILRSGLTRIGIGFVANANGDIWVTQMFSKP